MSARAVAYLNVDMSVDGEAQTNISRRYPFLTRSKEMASVVLFDVFLNRLFFFLLCFKETILFEPSLHLLWTGSWQKRQWRSIKQTT